MSETPWSLYTNTEEAWEAMLEACKKAKKSIDLEQFIFINDEIGKRFIETCAKKALEGVRVRFLWDAAGSFSFFGSSLVSELSKRNIQVAFFNPVVPRTLHLPRWWFFRNHRRSLVIDSEIAFTGSMSMWESTKAWKEAHMSLTGEVVQEIENAFGVMWDRAHNIKTNWGKESSVMKNGFKYVTNAPVRGKHFMYSELIEAIRGAHRYIYLVTPYFVPDRRLARVLRLGARRGVDVRILIPQNSDHPIVDLGGYSYFSKLLKSGVQIYRHKGKFIHNKVGIIDDEWATLGTMNLDNISLKYNFEANIVSSNKLFIEKLKDFFNQDLTGSEKLTFKQWEKRPKLQKFFEFLTKFIRSFL